MISHLVVATDGSPVATRAVKVALDLAASLKTAVVDVVCMVGERAGGDTLDEAATALAVAQELAGNAGVEITTHELAGSSPAEAVLAFAQKTKADIILAGTHGRRGLARLTMGSVCEALLRSSDIPVLAVRSESLL